MKESSPATHFKEVGWKVTRFYLYHLFFTWVPKAKKSSDLGHDPFLRPNKSRVCCIKNTGRYPCSSSILKSNSGERKF